MKHLLPTLIIGISAFTSCVESDDPIAHLVNEWQGKEIVFPANPTFTQFAADTVDYRIPAEASSPETPERSVYDGNIM